MRLMEGALVRRVGERGAGGGIGPWYHRGMKRVFLVFAAAAMGMPGCIAWEIRDEIRATNQHLCEVTPALAMTLHSVDQTNREIAKTQVLLAEVQAALASTQKQIDELHASLKTTDGTVAGVAGTLGNTNPVLTDLSAELERLRMLNDVHTTLQKVETSLGPLSKAMGSLGGAVSFLGLGGDASRDVLAEEERMRAAGGGAGSAAAEAGDGVQGGAEKADPLLGTWVMVYPPPGGDEEGADANPARITIFSADGRFITDAEGEKPSGGTWKREGRALTLTFDAAVPGQPPMVETLELLTLNARTLTLRREDVIRVHARP